MSFADQVGLLLDGCKSAFGEACEYRPLTGAPYAVTGIFNLISADVLGAPGVAVQSHEPTLGVKLADLAAAPKQGDKVLIRAVEYRIARLEDDGEGGSLLFLHKV